MKTSDIKLIAVFLISMTLIAFELSVMRSFSIGSWSNFGAMVISIALLGMGIAGTLLTFIRKKIMEKPDFWLSLSALLLVPGMASAHVLAQLVPFSPSFILSDNIQILWIAAYYIIYSIPFFIGAFFIGVNSIIILPCLVSSNIAYLFINRSTFLFCIIT